MTARRDFLRGLVAMPMIGGAVTLIGRPSAVAAVPTPDMLEAYKTWLHYERRFLCWEMAADPVCRARYRPERTDRVGYSKAIGANFAFIGEAGHYHGTTDGPQPSTRAALVMSTVGCDWREDIR